jgi:hypothetical protein
MGWDSVTAIATVAAVVVAVLSERFGFIKPLGSTLKQIEIYEKWKEIGDDKEDIEQLKADADRSVKRLIGWDSRVLRNIEVLFGLAFLVLTIVLAFSGAFVNTLIVFICALLLFGMAWLLHSKSGKALKAKVACRAHASAHRFAVKTLELDMGSQITQAIDKTAASDRSGADSTEQVLAEFLENLSKEMAPEGKTLPEAMEAAGYVYEAETGKWVKK